MNLHLIAGQPLTNGSVRFRFTTGVQTMGAGAMVLGNTIHVDPTDPRWAIRAGTTLPENPHDAWDSFNGRAPRARVELSTSGHHLRDQPGARSVAGAEGWGECFDSVGSGEEVKPSPQG